MLRVGIIAAMHTCLRDMVYVISWCRCGMAGNMSGSNRKEKAEAEQDVRDCWYIVQ